MATKPPKKPSNKKSRRVKPENAKHASFVQEADKLETEVREASPYRYKALRKKAIEALDETILKTTRTESMPDDAPIVVRDEATGLLMDEHGVPFLDNIESRVTKNKSARRRTPEQRQLMQKRLQQVRGFLSNFWSQKDIAETLAPIWKISKVSVYKYITIGVKLNMEVLKRTAGEWKGDSLAFWTRKITESESHKARANQDLITAQKTWELIDEKLQNALVPKPDATERQEESRVRLVASLQKMILGVNKRMDLARRTISACDFTIQTIGDRIDRLVGNYAPERIALTDAAGNDVQRSTMEPLTRAEVDNQLAIMVKALSPAQLAAMGLKPVEQIDGDATVLPSGTEGPSDPDAGAIYPIEVDNDERDDE